jgi:sensor histidine kinase YesM
LSLLNRYIDIQRARFGERLRVSVSVEDDARTALVPTLLLQPLVENAIKHGIGMRSRGGRIEISARRAATMLIVEVRDDGVGVGTQPIKDGVGLANCRSRLQTLFGDNASLQIEPAAGGGTVVRIEMPA